MPTTIYFSGSITGGRGDVGHYQRIVSALEKDGHRVLAGTVTAAHISDGGEPLDERAIFARDLGWIEETARANGILIAEVSTPSHGVGYEIATARYRYAIPVVCLYRPAATKRCSAMIRGDEGLVMIDYAEEDFDGMLGRLRATIRLLRE